MAGFSIDCRQIAQMMSEMQKEFDTRSTSPSRRTHPNSPTVPLLQPPSTTVR